MTVSLPMLLSVVLPILATTILFALIVSLALLFAPRPKGDLVAKRHVAAKVMPSRG